MFIKNLNLRVLDLQHFHWLAGHRLSVHIPAVPNMFKERVSNKANWKHLADKIRFGTELTEAEIDALVDNTTPGEHHGVFNNTIIPLELAG